MKSAVVNTNRKLDQAEDIIWNYPVRGEQTNKYN